MKRSGAIRGARWAMGVALITIGVMARGQSARPAGPLTEEGELGGAAFRIDIPQGWNGGLVMYAHGYERVAPARRGYNLVIVEAARRIGYAVAQSQYSVQGWAAREGILDTEALRRHFVAKYGRTYPTIIAGHSQGGAISFRTIELYPEVYDGALPMCGTAEPALKFFKERVFDMRLLFDYFFPGLPGSVVEFPDGERTMETVSAKARELIDAKPEAAERFVRMVNLPDVNSIPGVIGFWSEILRELTARTGGNAFDNRNTVYAGSEDDARLNREIPRHAADRGAVEYLRRWVTVTGRISDPVVAVHTFVDQLVPVESVRHMEQLAQLAGTTDLFVQLYVDRVGHCAFNAEETLEALTRLDRWVRTGERPPPGDITRTP